MICKNCGYHNPDIARFCKNCGVEITQSNHQQPSYIDETSALIPHQQKPTHNYLTLVLSIVIAISVIGIIICFLFLFGVFSNSSNPTEKLETPPPQSIVDDKMNLTSIYASQKNSTDTITISTTSKIEPAVTNLSDPHRLVLDFYGFSLEVEGDALNQSGVNFSNVRYANHEEYARVVIDISNSCSYEISPTENACTVKLTKTN